MRTTIGLCLMVLSGCATGIDVGHHDAQPGANDTGAPDASAPDASSCTCASAPVDQCLTAGMLRHYASMGSCVAGQCQYAFSDRACTCDTDHCVVDPCANVTCSSPPASACTDPSTLRIFDVDARCSAGTCSYGSRDLHCDHGCEAGACLPDRCGAVVCDTPPSQCHESTGTCLDGVCAYAMRPSDARCDDGDACTNGDVCGPGTCAGTALACSSPPAPVCLDAMTLRTASGPGTCSAGACSYVTSDAPCAFGCDSGVCRTHACVSETCNGTDDDCDGTTDEDIAPISCGTGACARTLAGCSGGIVALCTPGVAGDEICGNSIDDDCDSRVDESGFGPTGWEVRVSDATDWSAPEQLVWTGTEYAVLWEQQVTTGGHTIFRLHLSRVATDGTLPASAIDLTSATGTYDNGRLAWNGSGYGFVYWGYETWPDDATSFRLLAADGTPTATMFDIDSDPSEAPEIIWTGSEFGVSWMSRLGASMRFRRVSATGSPLGTITMLGTGHTSGELAWTGSEYGMTWDVYDYPSSNDTGYFTRLSASGVPIGSTVVTTPTPTPGAGCCGLHGLSDLAWDGSSFAIFRRGVSDHPTLTPVSAASVVGTPVTVASEQGIIPSFVWTGSEYVATWYTTGAGYPVLTIARVSRSGVLLDRYDIDSFSHPSVTQGVVGWDGSSMLASWSDTRTGSAQVYLARFGNACR